MTGPYKAIVIGASAGGMTVIKNLVVGLPGDFAIPVIIVNHIGPDTDGFWVNHLDQLSALKIKEADEKESIRPGHVYFAPANYHLLVERDHTFSLTVDERVNYARPAIDVLFETAAEAYRNQLIGIVLTGGNFDGAKGLKKIKDFGGTAIVQDPETAEAASMPAAAIRATTPDYIASPQKILALLQLLHRSGELKLA